MALGGKSTYVGDQPAALAVLFAALFTTRQSFMFGMIYGALACQKAGIPLDAFVDQIPVSIKVMQDYYELFAATVPAGDYSNPEASMTTYAAAIDDTLCSGNRRYPGHVQKSRRPFRTATTNA